MRSKKRISFRLRFKPFLGILTAFLFVQPSAFATDDLKPEALPKYDETRTSTIVEINPPETFPNDYEVTDSGELAKDKAAEMLERYPALEANPYAILVRFKSDATDNQVEELLNQTGSRIVDFYPTVNWYLIETPRGNTSTQKIFGRSYIVESVAIDSVIRVNSVNTNDPLINDVWGLDSNHGIDASVAWPISQNASEVIVAVIDSGIDPNHPDLLDAIWINPGEIADNGIDDDNNGFIDDTYGWDFTGEYDNTPQDEHGHGTHVAGTIAATRNNAEGIAGVANNVKIMTLRFLDKQGNGITSWAINALEYAVANGAAISNNSWGGGPYETPLYNAIAQAGNTGHLFVAAAGNSGNNSDSYPMYPAAYNLPNILSVAAINSTGGLAGFSNYGINTVDIAAPGVNILSTMSGESENCPNPPIPCYVSWQGTSMAAPHAAGVAALMLGVNNGLTPEEIIQIMQETIRPTSELNGKVRFGGELDGGGAISVAASSGSINFIGYSPGQEVTQGSTISLSAVAVDADGVDISENINWKDENDLVITTGDSISYTANTIGLLTLKAEVDSNTGDTFQKIAYFNVTAPSLIISSRDSIQRASPGDTVNIEWTWEGPSNETQELNATTLNKYQVESTGQTTYLLPDDRTPVELTFNSTGSGSIIDAMVGIRINHSWPAD
ncbi:MAG: S8 family peptidase, partial [Acidimicrobiales bacterium]